MIVGNRAFWCVGLAALLIGAAGCEGAKRGAVCGQVTLDGQPVDGGEIRFIPAVGIPAWAKIAKGRYAIGGSAGPSIGEARVEIRQARKTGKSIPAAPPAPPNAMIEQTVEAIPARYNLRSELTAKIEPGNNVADFALSTKP
jgi:hypothetical protein